ncbi:MAG: hypothetical protein ACOCWG_00060 [bacterium]
MIFNKQVNQIFFIYLSIIAILFAITKYLGMDTEHLLLMDDGYYGLAKSFVQGDSLLHKFRGPALPLIYAPMFLFPKALHPYLRLVLTSFIVYLILFFLKKITKDMLTDRQFLWGCMPVIVNPIWIHWTFKTSLEIYLCLLLIIFTYFQIEYFKTSKIKYFLISLIPFIISFFFKPVFIFIPVFIMIYSLVYFRNKNFIFTSIIAIIIGLTSYVIQDKITKYEYNDKALTTYERRAHYIHKSFLIQDSFWTDYVLKTGQFHKWSVIPYREKYRNGKGFYEYYQDWLKTFFNQYPNANMFFLNYYFFKNNPGLVIKKLLVSPIFFLGMSARPLESYVKLIFNIFILGLSFIGLKKLFTLVSKKQQLSIILIIYIVLAYSTLHFLTHSINRYFLPVMPLTIIWSGYIIDKIMNRLYFFHYFT